MSAYSGGYDHESPFPHGRKGHRQIKRLEAEERNAKWAALDPITQLDRLHRRPGFCAKQRARIMRGIDPRTRDGAA